MRRDQLWLTGIRERCDQIASFLPESAEDFYLDTKTQEAVIRGLEVIGEAARSVSTELREDHPEVPWKLMVGMRNRLIHHYFGVRSELVWTTSKELVPPLKAQIDVILENRFPEEP